MTIRQNQVAEQLKRTVSEVLQRKVSDPRIRGLVSVTRVEVSPDLRQASIYVSVVPAAYERRTIAGLEHARGHIHKLVRQSIVIKTVPNLAFKLDDSLKKQAAVFAAINQGLEREEPAK